jgi:NitT/TauT family transport system permease protein
VSKAGWIRIALLAGLVLILEGLCRFGFIKPLTLIPPSKMVVALYGLFDSGRIQPDIRQTLGNVLAAFLAATSVGSVLGVIVHGLPRLRRAIDPLLVSYYAVPFFVFYPLFIVMFGMNDLPIIVIGFLFAVVAMLVNVLNGLDRVPRVLLKAARAYRMGRVQTALRVTMPAAAPHLLTGIKLAVAYSFIGVIASEFIMSGSGLGYAIGYAYNNFETATMYALMLFILVLVATVNAVLHVYEQRLLRRRGQR